MFRIENHQLKGFAENLIEVTSIEIPPSNLHGLDLFSLFSKKNYLVVNVITSSFETIAKTKLKIAARYFNPGCFIIFQKSLRALFHAPLQLKG